MDRGCGGDATETWFAWAKSHYKKACERGVDLDRLAKILTRVEAVIDVEKTMGVEDADPYVIELAFGIIENGTAATVITEERTDKPKKMALSTACGLWGVPVVPMLPFLKHAGIWP